MGKTIQVGILPFGEDSNPYQELTRRAIAGAGASVRVFPKSNWFPLSRAAMSGVDVLHLDWPHSFYRGNGWCQTKVKKLMFLIQMAHMRRVNIVWTIHNLEEHNSNVGVDPSLLLLAKTAKAIVSLHASGESMIREQYGLPDTKPIYHIPHGHYADWYATNLLRDPIRSQWGYGDCHRVGLLLGRLQPYKGIEQLIPAFLNCAGNEDRLLIAGNPQSGRYLEAILKLAKGDQRIQIVGRFLSKQEVEECMTCADYGVFPFVNIFNSGSVITALSFGKPVIASAKGAILEVVPPSCLFDAGEGTQAEVEDAMRRVQKSENLQLIGSTGKETVIDKFGWKAIGERWADVYQKVVASE